MAQSTDRHLSWTNRVTLLMAVAGWSALPVVAHGVPLSWQRMTPNAGFHVRDSAGEVVFNNKMWIMGGWYNSWTTTELRDVWSSSDGVNWTQATANAGWVGTQHPVALVFDNKMWMMGGYQGGRLSFASQTSEVWSTPDGASWTKVTDAPWSARYAMGGAVLNDKMWILGGLRSGSVYGGGPSIPFNDVWSSTDGANWVKETAHASWSPRGQQRVLTFDDKLWLLGGDAYNSATGNFELKNDVWSSPDGVNWTLVTEHAAWSPRKWHEAIVYNNEMWVLGGATTTSTNFNNDIWHSSDGVNWTQVVNGTVWSPRHEQSVYNFQDKLWVVAGGSASGVVNDVWQTSIAGLAGGGTSNSVDETVPEPGTLLLVLVMILGLTLCATRIGRRDAKNA